MEILQAAFLGIIQGATEILPISSSGHLVLAPWLFNFQDPGLAFDVALHLGTLLAVLFYFYNDIAKIIRGSVEFMIKKDPSDYWQKLFLFLIIATIPGALAGFFLESLAEDAFRSPLLIALTLSFFGIIFLVSQKLGKQKRLMENIKIKDSLIIGLAQALAIIPGVSRSGITITAGLFRNLSKEEAARFSFLISVPIIFGAAVFSLSKANLDTLFSPVFIVGFLSALLSSFITIKFLLGFVKKHDFNIFIYYRFVLAGLILLLAFFK